MESVLITGVGYIGSQLAVDLLSQGYEVVGLDNFFSTPRRLLRPLRQQPRFILEEGSINSPTTLERVFSRYQPKIVYHLAAQPSAHPEAAKMAYTEMTNLVGLRHVIEAAVRHGVRRLVYASSFWVYGSHLHGEVTESSPLGSPPDAVHATKLYAEALLQVYAARHQLETISVRLGIVYGLGPIMKSDPRFLTVPHRFCLLARTGQPLTLHPGNGRRLGFIHLADASYALRALGSAVLPFGEGRATSGNFLPVNAVAEAVAVREVAEMVMEIARRRGIPVKIAGVMEPISQQSWRPRSLLERVNPPLPPARRMESSLDEVFDHFLSAVR